MMKKRYIALIALLVLTLASCTTSKTNFSYQAPNEDDNYRNYYEIFVRSFYDSDGDGLGDLNGVTKKLDYIKDLGFDGIWLMPIHQSSSYHKYDVRDYYSIDKEYGSLDDMKNLINSCKEKNIKLIMDLVVNHTSDLNKWFIEATKAKYNNDTTNKYINYYNFSDKELNGYRKYGNFYYEARFASDMPDLNLDSTDVRKEIVDIMKYWLDLGVSGFRLDAVTSYYTGDIEKNKEFLTFLNTEAKKINSNCYIVGEAWTNTSEISKYYESGIDSFFGFGTDQEILYSINTQSSSYYSDWTKSLAKIAQGHIEAPFIGNHDTGRAAGILTRNEAKVKFGYGLLSLMSGSSFAYYGDEIGMVGSGVDPNKRIGMLWTLDKLDGFCANPPGVTKAEYIFPSVSEQSKDEYSILNYYKKANYLRSSYEAIKKGDYSFKDYDSISVLTKTYNDKRITIAINFSNEEANATLDSKYNLKEVLVTSKNDKVKISGNNIKMSGYSIAIIEEVK